MIKTITMCRICGSSKLEEFLSLGDQPLSGVFPSDVNVTLTSGPLRLLFCENCSQVQLGENYSQNEMYGENYGYRSSLNPHMVAHLRNISQGLLNKINFQAGDVVCDIGSNDGTFLKNFSNQGLNLVGIDPTAMKLAKFYNDDVSVISKIFSSHEYYNNLSRPAKLVTSIAMFYDLEDPIFFAKEIFEILESGGYWFFEQSYAPWMQKSGAYDTICHEHLLYYSLINIKYILDQSGFTLISSSTNATNGGSVAILARKNKHVDYITDGYTNWLLQNELNSGSATLDKWSKFAVEVKNQKENLVDLINKLTENKKSIFGLGASTKGNVLLNYSKIDSSHLPMIGEVNQDKFGSYTPGSLVPIVDERIILEMKPDYLLFLPWHFKEHAIAKYNDYLTSGGRFIFPLPNVEVLGY